MNNADVFHRWEQRADRPLPNENINQAHVCSVNSSLQCQLSRSESLMMYQETSYEKMSVDVQTVDRAKQGEAHNGQL